MSPFDRLLCKVMIGLATVCVAALVGVDRAARAMDKSAWTEV